jgi:predicted DCC family thiol-disulfide oxidoreductase YuxK
MGYWIIYDGRCNLCVSLVQALEQLDQGKLFRYVPMQDHTTLSQWQITPQDCEAGMILRSDSHPQQRWQGSNAAEEIARLFPLGGAVIAAYRQIPSLKWLGDQVYGQVRDHRYAWFGARSETYVACPACDSGTTEPPPPTPFNN